MKVLEGRDVFDQNRAHWDDLLARTPGDPFFLSSDWLASWARTAPADRRMWLAVEPLGDGFAAGLPLTLGRGQVGRIHLDKLEIAGAPWFDALEVPAIDARAREDFVRALLEWCTRELRGWTALELRELPSDGATAAVVESAAHSLGLACDRRVCSRAPFVRVTEVCSGDIALSKNLKSQLKRSAKRLAELGQVEIRFELVDLDGVPKLLAECAEVERASWKGRTKSGVLQPDSGLAFFSDLAPRLARTRRLALATLTIDGSLVAYHWGFKSGARFLSYNLAQLPRVDAVGPGTYLLHGMIERAAALGIEVMDASRGSLTRPHSLARYAGGVREHLQFVVYNGNAAGRLVGMAKRRVIPGIRKIAQRFAAHDGET